MKKLEVIKGGKEEQEKKSQELFDKLVKLSSDFDKEVNNG